MKHLTLSISDIALQFRQQGDSSDGRHILEHKLLPVLTQSFSLRRNGGGEVGVDDLLFTHIRGHTDNTITEGFDGVVQFLALTSSWCQHHLIGSLQVFLVLEILDGGILAISLTYDSQFQFFCEVIERVTDTSHLLSLIIPGFHLHGVDPHLHLQIIIDNLVFLDGALGSTVQTVFHDGKAVEPL